MTEHEHTELGAAGYEKYIRDKVLHVANTLNTLTPYERSLVLHAAQAIWDEREAKRPQAHEADDNIFLLGQWIAQAFMRLSPPAQAGLLEVAKKLDDAERFERLVESEE